MEIEQYYRRATNCSAQIRERSIARSVSVCLSVSVREPLVRELTTFSMRVTYGPGSVILCRRRDVSYISSFVDDVMFLILGPCRHAASVAATPLRSW